MASYSVATLQEKLSRLSASQESIETLSLWIIHHKAFAKISVGVWTASFTTADADHRLVLLYLANDVLQNSRRKGADVFSDLFREPLEQLVPQIRGQKIQSSVERMFRIWRDRKVYDKAFVKRLDQLLTSDSTGAGVIKETVDVVATPPPEPLPDFKLSLLEDAVQELSKFQGEMRVKEASVSSLPMDVWDAGSLTLLKDKSEGKEFSGKFDKAWATLKDYSDCLGIEVNERVTLSSMLASCLSEQARQLERVQQDLQVYQKLLKQLRGCREKLNARQKDLERAQQTATSDPSCKEDLTEVGDMEIDSEEEMAMETQQPPLPAVSVATLPTPPSVFHSAPQLSSAAPLQPAAESSAPFTSPPIIPTTPPIMNSAPHLMGQGIGAPGVASQLPYSQPLMSEFTGPIVQPPLRFPRPSFLPPSAPHSQMSPRQQGLLGAPPTMMHPRYPFGGPRLGVPPQLRGNLAPPQPAMAAQRSAHLTGPAEPLGEGVERGPVVESMAAVQESSSLDDRLQSLVGRKSLGRVLLQEYAESEDSGDRPYTPTNMPLLSPSPGVAGEADDESITTPTPQLDMSPSTPEEVGQPKFNPANPIMTALYRSPTHSPDGSARAEVDEDQSEKPAALVGENTLLSGVDTGMLQTILKNVQGMTSPLAESPGTITSPSSRPSQTLPSPQRLSSDPPPHTLSPSVSLTATSSSVHNSSPTSPLPAVGNPTTAATTAASNIKITSSLTSLLDEIFPQLSRSLQERKRKQEQPLDEPAKQPRISETQPVRPTTPTAGPAVAGPVTAGPMVTWSTMARPPATGPNMVRPTTAGHSPPLVVMPNGPRPPNGALSPQAPPMPRPLGPRGPPRGMIIRGPRLDGEGGGMPLGMRMMRPRGPPFEGFRPRGPPRLESGFRPLGHLRPGMSGERLMGPRPPPRPFPPPRMPPLAAGQNFTRPPFHPGLPVRMGNPRMELNHFSEKPPQSHDGLQSAPPPGMGMWP